MHFAKVIAFSLLAPLAVAYGADTPSQLRARDPFAAMSPRGSNERCGPEYDDKVCGKNECCSSTGYCGTSKEHCKAPDCQFRYGPGCDGNKTPSGKSTRKISRPRLGKIPYGGAGVYACTKPGVVAITYDDGPYIYTEGIMKQFEARGGRATFFLTGNNLGRGAIDEKWAGIVKKMYKNGHQVASHSWSHPDLSDSTKEEIYDQMIKNEMAIRNILGRFPTYMRPPYSSCDSECARIMEDLGYVIAYFDVDTDDYNNLSSSKIQIAKNEFKKGIDSGDRLVIAHDIHKTSAQDLTKYMLDYIYKKGLKAVTMGECLGDPKENWYRKA